MKKAIVTIEAEQDVEVEVAPTVWQALTVCFSVSAQITYAPAILSGPPESCHPDESEIDLGPIFISTILDEYSNPVDATAELQQKCRDALSIPAIQEALWEEFALEYGI